MRKPKVRDCFKYKFCLVPLIAGNTVKKSYAKLLKKEGMLVDSKDGANASTSMEVEEHGAEGEDMVLDPKRPSASIKGKGRAQAADWMDEDDSGPKLKKRKSDCLSPAPEVQESEPSSNRAQPYMHPSRRNKTSAPERPAREPPKKKAKPTPEELEVIRAKRLADKNAWNRKTKKGQPNLNSREYLISVIRLSLISNSGRVGMEVMLGFMV